DVGVAAVGAGFDDGDADVDGVALGAVAGGGPAELDVLGGVVGRDGGPAALEAVQDDGSVGRDLLDGPGLAVPDLGTLIGDERCVVAPSGHEVAGVDLSTVVGADRWLVWVVGVAGLDGFVDGAGRVAAARGDRDGAAGGNGSLVLVGDALREQGGVG